MAIDTDEAEKLREPFCDTLGMMSCSGSPSTAVGNSH